MKKSLHVIMALIVCISSAQTISAISPQSEKKQSHRVLMHRQEKVKVEKIERKTVKEHAVPGKIKKVLTTKNFKDGSQFRIVQLENGMVKKQITHLNRKPSKKLSTGSGSQANLKNASSEESIFEGFEAWDEENRDWIPEGWLDESKVGTQIMVDSEGYEYNFTWATSHFRGYDYSSEGQYSVFAQFAYLYPFDAEDEESELYLPVPQDEWLITPEVKVKQDYVCSFDLNYSPFFARLNNDSIDEYYFDAMNTIAEVLISTDKGATWTKKWDTVEDALSYSEDELWELAFIDNIWLKISLDLNEYVGKDIQVAFRYINDNGESVYVDAVNIGLPLPKASYNRPEGYLISGLSEDYLNIDGYNVIFGNAFTPTQWQSSLENVDNVSWDFDDYGIRNEENPVVTIPYGLYENPVLSASGKGGSIEYQLGVAGENNLLALGGDNIWSMQGERILFGLGNYNLQYGLTTINKASADGTSDYGIFKGIGNYFEKPADQFMFETFYVHAGEVVAKPDEPVRLTIYAVDEEGNVGDVIATSEAWPADFIIVEDEGDDYKYYTIPFKFKEIDPETGREADSYIEIESAFLAEFSNYESADVFFQGHNRSGENYAYVTLEEDSYISLADWGINTSCLFDMDAVFPYLYAADNKFAVPENGGAKTFEIESYWLPEDWQFENLPDWITFNNDYVADEETGIVTLSFTATALPEGFSGRSADVKIQSYACDMILQFKQGDSSFTGLMPKTSPVKIARQGNNFILSCPEGTNAVAVYNITGQKIKEYPLNGRTTYSIPTDDLEKGVYIFKFSGKTNESVKVIR